MSMKWFLGIVVLVALLLLGALGWQWLAADPGLLQMRIRGYVIETTVIVAVAVLVTGLLILWLLARLLRAPLQWLAGRRLRRTRHAFAQAELRLREGHWGRAEKQFLRAAEDPDFRIPSLLEAAQAAHARGDAAQAKDYLARLDTDGEGLRLAQLERAREALAGDQPEQCLGLLATLDPLPPSGCRLRIDALRASHRAGEALAELPGLHRTEMLDGLAFAQLELAVSLQALAEAGDADTLARIWAQLPKGLRRTEPVLATYVDRGEQFGLDDGAAVIEAQLRQDWSEALVRRYGRLRQPTPAQRLRTAEKWLAAHPDSVALNVALARLELQQDQPRKAEEYLGHALSQANDAEAWELMADAFTQQQLLEPARVALVNALRGARGEPPLPLSAAGSRGDNLGLFAVAEERSEHGVPRLPGIGAR